MATNIPINREGLREVAGQYVVITVQDKKRHVMPIDVPDDSSELVFRAYNPKDPGPLGEEERVPLLQISAAQVGTLPKTSGA